jgi:hypothetical protein
MKTFIKIVMILIVILATALFLLKDKRGTVTFATYYGTENDEQGRAVISTDDGGYLIVGSASRPLKAPGTSVYLVKTDGSGKMIWERQLPEKGYEGGKAVISTDDGGYLIAGDISSATNKTDIYLIKLDKYFNKLWGKSYGGGGDDFVKTLIKTDDGGYAILGASRSFGDRKVGYFIKTDANGKKLWENTYVKGADMWRSAIQTPDSGYFILGTTDSTIALGMYNIYLIKIDKDGKKLWENIYGYEDGEDAETIIKTDDGNYAIFGWTYSFGEGEPDMYLLKVDENGGVIREKVFKSERHEKGYAIDSTSDGGLILLANVREPAGTSLIKRIEGIKKTTLKKDQNFYLVKLDRDGNEEWSAMHGGEYPEYASFVAQTPDGGYIMLGSTESYGLGHKEIFFVKTDKNGKVSLW